MGANRVLHGVEVLPVGVEGERVEEGPAAEHADDGGDARPDVLDNNELAVAAECGASAQLAAEHEQVQVQGVAGEAGREQVLPVLGGLQGADAARQAEEGEREAVPAHDRGAQGDPRDQLADEQDRVRVPGVQQSDGQRDRPLLGQGHSRRPQTRNRLRKPQRHRHLHRTQGRHSNTHRRYHLH